MFLLLTSVEMPSRNPDLVSMHRLLHRHEWSDIHDWVGAIGTLADLSDAEIEQVTIPCRQDPGATEGEGKEEAGGA
jgi:hypothetical protein